MIYDVVQNLGTGDISVDSNKIKRSYTYDYLVITDHTDTPQDIYAQAKSKGLPVYGSVSKSGVKLSSISIDRWDQNNAKSIPSYHLPKKPNGSYAVWKYQVTYSQDSSGNASGNFQDVQYDVAYNLNTSIKQYQQRTNTCYKFDLDTNTTGWYFRDRILCNVLQQPLMIDMVLRNLIVSFDFNIPTSKLPQWITDYIPSYVNSVNSEDVVVAGIKIESLHAKILSMSASKSNEETSTVHVQLQLYSQKHVARQEFPEMSYFAIPPDEAGFKHAYRVQKLNIDVRLIPEVREARWFDKEYGLGNFSDATLEGKQLVFGVDYDDYPNKVILKYDGTYYKWKSQEELPSLDDPDIGVIYAYTSRVVPWKGLNLPKKLK